MADVPMTVVQKQIFDTLQNAVRETLPIIASREKYVFTEFQGITVLIATKRINPKGGYKIPALRSYTEEYDPTNLDAVLRARELFGKQVPDRGCSTGHFGPIVNSDWLCNRTDCPCNSGSETYEELFHRSTGRWKKVR